MVAGHQAAHLAEEYPMGTMVSSDKDIVKLLNDLIALDYDAIEAYDAAISRLSLPRDKDQLRQFLSDHQRHTVNLGEFVTKYGQQPVTKGDIKQILTKGKVVLAGLSGDSAICSAMKSNEDDTNAAYERAVAQTGLPDNIRQVLDRNLADERRHRQWFIERVQSLRGDQPSAQL
jgi:uncharacterized protein (TIGR02284 family)